MPKALFDEKQQKNGRQSITKVINNWRKNRTILKRTDVLDWSNATDSIKLVKFCLAQKVLTKNPSTDLVKGAKPVFLGIHLHMLQLHQESVG